MVETIFSATVFVFIIGICIGSFLNVVALRGLSGESIVFPASKCPKCQNPLKWFDNIPILSYLILRGKCRNCKEHISLQYPIVEFSTGLLFLLGVYYTFATSNIDTTPLWLLFSKMILLLVVISSAILMIITDIKEKVVINSHFWTFIVASFLYTSFSGGLEMLQANAIKALIGLAVGVLLVGGYMLITSFLLKKQTLGDGDVYIAAGMGALLGYKYLIIALCLSVLLCVVYVLPFFFKRLIEEKKYLFCTLLFLFFAVAIGFKYYVLNFDVYFDLYWILVLALIGLGATCAIMLVRMIKFKPEDELLYVPFGPSLLIATLLMTFFGHYCVQLIRTFLYLS